MTQSILTTAKELLKVNKNILKGLHDTFDFDFDFEEGSSVEIKEIKTPFTLNRILKENNLTNKRAIILINDSTKEFRKNEFSVAVIEKNYIRFNFANLGFWQGLNKYYVKYDFENDRKNTSCRAFLIYDNKNEVEHHNYYDKKKNLINFFNNDVNFSNRAKCSKNEKESKIFTYTDFNLNDYYISELKDVRIDNNNILIDIQLNNYSYRTKNINDIIDKSGYNINLKRTILKQKAKELKAQKELNKVQKRDFSQVNERIRVKIFNTKKVLMDKLQNASFDVNYKSTTESNYKTTLKRLEMLNDVYISYTKHLDNLSKMYNNELESYCSGYRNIEQVKNTLKDLKDKLGEINQNY